MIDGFMDEYGILVIFSTVYITQCFVFVALIWLAFFLAILIRSMLKGEKNE
jgi:hypothetical protein